MQTKNSIQLILLLKLLEGATRLLYWRGCALLHQGRPRVRLLENWTGSFTAESWLRMISSCTQLSSSSARPLAHTFTPLNAQELPKWDAI